VLPASLGPTLQAREPLPVRHVLRANTKTASARRIARAAQLPCTQMRVLLRAYNAQRVPTRRTLAQPHAPAVRRGSIRVLNPLCVSTVWRANTLPRARLPVLAALSACTLRRVPPSARTALLEVLARPRDRLRALRVPRALTPPRGRRFAGERRSRLPPFPFPSLELTFNYPAPFVSQLSLSL
jgi:hypothetical protein